MRWYIKEWSSGRNFITLHKSFYGGVNAKKQSLIPNYEEDVYSLSEYDAFQTMIYTLSIDTAFLVRGKQILFGEYRIPLKYLENDDINCIYLTEKSVKIDRFDSKTWPSGIFLQDLNPNEIRIFNPTIRTVLDFDFNVTTSGIFLKNAQLS